MPLAMHIFSQASGFRACSSCQQSSIGIRTRDFIGVANLMWGSDYPHGDSIYPESQPILDSLLSPDEEDDRFTVTVANVVKLYNLPFDRAH